MVNGKATFAKRTLSKYDNGTHARRGQTRQFNSKCLQKFYNDIYSVCPLQYHGTTTVYKHGMPAITAYLYYSLNNDMGQGYAHFHHTNLSANDAYTCDSGDSFAKSLGIPCGCKYIKYARVLPVSFTGDAGPVKNAKRGIHSMCAAFFKILGFVDGVTHSLYSGICVLISSLSESSFELQNIVQEIGSSVPQSSATAVYCHKLNAYVCFQLERWNAGDWKWCHQMHNMSVGCSAHFSLTEICLWENGECFGLHYDDCYKCLMSTYFDPWTVPSFDECRNGNFNGYCLSTAQTYACWGNLTQNAVDAQKSLDIANGHGDRWNTPQKEHKHRVSLAQQCHGTFPGETHARGHGILKASTTPIAPALLDAAHALWSFVLTIVALFVMLMYCIWGWTESDVLSVIQRFQTNTLTDQVVEYMSKNKNRNVNVPLKLRTDGTTNIRMFARWPFAIQYAAFVADEYESRNPNSTHAATLMLVVLWIVGSEMRYVFAMFWKGKFDVTANNSRPIEIETMIRKAFRAMYISCHLGSILVC